jgi:hypothetical protein
MFVRLDQFKPRWRFVEVGVELWLELINDQVGHIG